MSRPTVHDIAKAAGVSLATVDRVLNSRPGVREKTVLRVRRAVETLGYVRDINAANLARQKKYRFLFVLPEGRSQFLQALEEAVAECAVGFGESRCEIHLLRAIPKTLADVQDIKEKALSSNCDGVAIMCHETPLINHVIAYLKENRVTVVTLVTDQPTSEREHFVGIDNVAAGKTAGVLIGKFTDAKVGKIGVIVNSKQSRDMVDRCAGFDAVLSAKFPSLEALPSLEGLDDHERVADVFSRLWEEEGPLVGLYCAGAGTRGVTRVIQERGLAGRLTVVAHELTPHCRRALEEGWIDAVITQNVGHLARSAVRVLKAKADNRNIIESQETIRIEITIKENLS